MHDRMDRSTDRDRDEDTGTDDISIRQISCPDNKKMTDIIINNDVFKHVVLVCLKNNATK